MTTIDNMIHLRLIESHLEYQETLAASGPGPSDHEFCKFTQFMRVQTPDGKGLRTSTKRPIVIYALIDPRDMTTRYVGQTRSMRARRQAHWNAPANAQMVAWRDSLKEDGLKFIIAPITVTTVRGASAAEAYWIAFYRSLGTIYNVNDGEVSVKSKDEPRSSVDAWGYRKDER